MDHPNQKQHPKMNGNVRSVGSVTVRLHLLGGRHGIGKGLAGCPAGRLGGFPVSPQVH